MKITKMDVKGAKLTIKNSINPKEIATAQKVINRGATVSRPRRKEITR